MRHRAGTRLALLLSPLLLLAGACASGGVLPGRGDDSRREIDALKARIVELQRQVTVHQVELARLQERLTRLEGGGPPPARGGAAPPAAARRPAPQQPSAPAGRELYADDIEEVEIDPVRTSPDPPPARTPPRTPPASPPPAPPAAEEGRPVDAAGQALYDQGYALYHQGRYVDAEAAFQRFLQQHVDTDLADNAGYWIGEARFARDDFRGALAAFQEAIERHPQGNKVPDSLLKVGSCLERLGDLEGARDTYRELIGRFPGTGAAATAEERLQALP